MGIEPGSLAAAVAQPGEAGFEGRMLVARPGAVPGASAVADSPAVAVHTGQGAG